MKTLRAEKLDLRFDQRWLCKNLEMDFAPGEVWGILGPNGCGKTTLLQTLAGLHPPAAGVITFNGLNLARLSRKSIAQSIGILLQDHHFTFPQTAWDYCAVARYPHLGYWQKPSPADLRIIRQALAQMELDAFAHRSVTTLSGGEKRRLAIAALLAQTPSIYLLDEPANHLDIHHQIQVLRFFASEARGKATSVIMSLHDVNLAQQFCDKVLLMFGGGEVLQGAKNEVLTQENVSRLYKHPMSVIQQGEKQYWLG